MTARQLKPMGAGTSPTHTHGWTVHVELQLVHPTGPNEGNRLACAIIDQLADLDASAGVSEDIVTATMSQPAQGPFGGSHLAAQASVDRLSHVVDAHASVARVRSVSVRADDIVDDTIDQTHLAE